MRTIGLALFLMPAPVWAADWKFIATSATDTIIFVDVSSIRPVDAVRITRPFQIREVWTKSDHSKDRTKKARQSTSLYRVNCEQRTMMTAQSTAYDIRGAVTDTWSDDDFGFKYRAITPDTIGEAIADFACGHSALPGFATE